MSAVDLKAAQSSILARLGIFRLAQLARAENYGSTAIMHPKLMHAPTGSWVNNRLCPLLSRYGAFSEGLVFYKMNITRLLYYRNLSARWRTVGAYLKL